MDRVEMVARAMARADGLDPDQPLGGWQSKRIVGRTIPVRYDRQLACWNYCVPLAKRFIAASAALAEE